MFGSSCGPATRLKALWLLFHFLKGLSVRLEQLQQLRQGLRLRKPLQEGLRPHGAIWLARRLGSLKKPQLMEIGVSLNVPPSNEMRNKDMADALLTKFKCIEPVFDLQCVVAEGGPARLRRKLRELRVLELKRMAEEIGLPGGGIKEELITKLFNHVSSQESVRMLDCHKQING
jgi:hypothetical protein